MLSGLLPITLFKVEDHSMEPALKPGDFVLVNRWYLNLKVGDIVVLTPYEKKAIFFLKRINSISKGWFMVLGDNLQKSTDSRKFGPVKRKDIVGKVVLRI